MDAQQVAPTLAGLIVRPPLGRRQHSWRGRVESRLLTRWPGPGFEDDHAGEEAVGEHPLGERLVVVVGDRRAVDDQAGLVDDPPLFTGAVGFVISRIVIPPGSVPPCVTFPP